MIAASRRLPELMGRMVLAAVGLASSIARASNQQILRIPGHVVRDIGLLATRCFPACIVVALVLGRFLDRFGTELQAPGQLAEAALAPMGFLIASLSFILMRGVGEAEQYAVDIAEGGFRSTRDQGGNPATDIVAPHILSASLGLGLLSAATVAFVYIGASPTAAIGISSHPAVTGLASAVVARAGQYGLLYGAYAATAAFLVALDGNRPMPGSIGRRFIVVSTPVLLVMVGWPLWL